MKSKVVIPENKPGKLPDEGSLTDSENDKPLIINKRGLKVKKSRRQSILTEATTIVRDNIIKEFGFRKMKSKTRRITSDETDFIIDNDDNVAKLLFGESGKKLELNNEYLFQFLHFLWVTMSLISLLSLMSLLPKALVILIILTVPFSILTGLFRLNIKLSLMILSKFETIFCMIQGLVLLVCLVILTRNDSYKYFLMIKFFLVAISYILFLFRDALPPQTSPISSRLGSIYITCWFIGLFISIIMNLFNYTDYEIVSTMNLKCSGLALTSTMNIIVFCVKGTKAAIFFPDSIIMLKRGLKSMDIIQ